MVRSQLVSFEDKLNLTAVIDRAVDGNTWLSFGEANWLVVRILSSRQNHFLSGICHWFSEFEYE